MKKAGYQIEMSIKAGSHDFRCVDIVKRQIKISEKHHGTLIHKFAELACSALQECEYIMDMNHRV